MSVFLQLIPYELYEALITNPTSNCILSRLILNVI